jgi:hypothetical protein
MATSAFYFEHLKIQPVSKYGGFNYEAANMVVRTCRRVGVFAEPAHRHRMKTLYDVIWVKTS